MSLRTLLNLIMPVFYIVVGGVLCTTDVLSDTIGQYRMGLGVLLLSYGGLRAFLFWRKRNQQDDTEVGDDRP